MLIVLLWILVSFALTGVIASMIARRELQRPRSAVSVATADRELRELILASAEHHRAA